MERMKKFFLYFLMFLSLFIYVSVFSNLGVREEYLDITNYKINTNSPKIEILEAKSCYTNGYIKGNVINDTGEHIRQKYLQLDFYNSNGSYVGTESKELKYFNVNETIKFDIDFKYRDVKKIELKLVDEVIKPKKNIWDFLKFNI